MSLWEELAAALAAATTEREVLAAVTDVAAPALGVQTVNVSVLTDAGQTLRLVKSVNTPPAVEEAFQTYSARAALPTTDALDSGRPVLLASLQDRDERYPLLRDVVVEENAFAVLPLIHAGRPWGTLGLGWREPQVFSPERVAVLERVAHVCAGSLARSEAHAREARARARAERTAARLENLHTLGTRLAAVVRTEDVAATVIGVCRPALGATAATITAYDGAVPDRVLAGGPDWMTMLPARELTEVSLVREVVTTRRPVLITSRDDRDRRFPDLAGLDVPQQSWANLPLLVDGRLLGVAAFGWDDPREFTDEDLEFLGSLAAHTAIALDRARLLEAVQAAADAARATARQLRVLQEVTAGLARAATSDQIAEVLASHGISPGAAPLDPELAAFAATVAELAAQAQARATRYETEYHTSHQLQQALLPAVPQGLPGACVAVRYRPADPGRDVGGDWYDVFAVPGDGSARTGFAIGDVVGHDLQAVTVMAQLQPLLRSAALSGASPAEILTTLDAACDHIEGAMCSTAGYAEYHPDDGTLTFARAGHPPPLLVTPGPGRSDGPEGVRTAAYLAGGGSHPLGVVAGERPQTTVAVPPGSLLVWYSDGLVERRRGDIQDGLDRLAALAAALPGPGSPGWPGLTAWVDTLLREMTAGQPVEDDIVLACLHLTPAR